MESAWHYNDNGQPRGPITEAELRDLRNQGRISDATLVWRSEMPGWLPLGQVFPSDAALRPPPLSPPPPPPISRNADSGNDLVSICIPKNNWALAAYYLGIFCFIPCFGHLMAPAALVMGIIGIRHANAHPEARGKGHSWVGIIMGGLFTLIWWSITLLAIIGAFAA